MNDIAKLEETELPPISSFYNCLTNSACSEDDYAKAQKA